MQMIKMRCNNCDAPLELDLDNAQTYCPYCGEKLLIGFDQIGSIIAEKEKTKRTINREEQKTQRAKMTYEYKAKEKDVQRKENAHGLAVCIGVLLIICLYFASKSGLHSKNVANLQQLELEIEELIQDDNYELARLKVNKMYLDDRYSSEEAAVWDKKREDLLEIIEKEQREYEVNNPDNIFMPAKSSSFKGKNYEEVMDQFKVLGFTNITAQVASESPGFFDRNDTIEHILIGGRTEFTTEDYFAKDTPIILYYYQK